MKTNIQFLAFFLCSIAITFAQKKEKPSLTLITNVQVWDGTVDTTIASDVLIQDNLITKVSPNIKK